MKRTCDLHSTPQDAHGRTARNSWRCQQRLPHDPGSWQQLVRRGPASAPSGHARAGCRGSLVASLKPAELAKLKPPSTCPIHKILTTQVFEVCKIRRMDRTFRHHETTIFNLSYEWSLSRRLPQPHGVVPQPQPHGALVVPQPHPQPQPMGQSGRSTPLWKPKVKTS